MKQLLILLCFASSALGVAQNAVRSPSHSPATSQSFDVEATSLPPHFTGSNPDAIYEAAKKNILGRSKSEFESNLEYQDRLDGLSNKPFMGNLSANDHFAFVLGRAWRGSPPVSALGQSEGALYGYVEPAYDAEAKELTLKIPIEALSDVDGNFYRWASLLRRTQTHLGSYVGQNAFGVKRTVDRLAVNDVDVILQDAEWLDFSCTHETDSESCSVGVDPLQARSLSKSAEVVVVGSLVPPFVSSQNEVSTPSIDQPSELHFSHRFLHMRLDELLIVNSQSGEIMERYSRKKHGEEYPLNVEFRARKDAVFSDPRCTENAYLFPSSVMDVYYSVDGGEEQHKFLDSPLLIPAKQFVDVRVVYCNISRIQVLLNGKEHELTCEKQTQFIANRSKCSRVERAP